MSLSLLVEDLGLIKKSSDCKPRGEREFCLYVRNVFRFDDQQQAFCNKQFFDGYIICDEYFAVNVGIVITDFIVARVCTHIDY